VVEQGAGGGIEDQALQGGVGGDLPGQLRRDRAVARELAGLLVEPEQRGERHQHVDQRLAGVDGLRRGEARTAATRGADAGVVLRVGSGALLDQGAGEQADQQVGPPRVHAAGIVSGEPGEPLEARSGVGGGQERPQRRHAVLLVADRHPAVAAGGAVAFVRTLRVGLQHRPLQRGLELGEGLFGRAIQNPPLRLLCLLRREVEGGVADGGDPPLVQQALLPGVQGGRQDLGRLHRPAQPGLGREPGQVQREPDLVGGEPPDAARLVGGGHRGVVAGPTAGELGQ
jgi:hypothetical protein